MAIYANTFIITGSNNNIPQVYANSLSPEGTGSNININSDIVLSGNVITTKRMDVAKTLFATFRPTSNILFNGSNELQALSNETNRFVLDYNLTDMFGLEDMQMDIPFSSIFDETTGIIRAPFSGFINLQMQGAFSNDGNMSNVHNGVYYYFPNRAHSNARVSASITTSDIVSTSHTLFMLSNDQILPTFYTNDSNAVLLNNGETYIGFSFLIGAKPQHSNYYRV
jgi:hypothetical protein